jgi:uncharacterized membrane protein YcjF (UPF0283 family)
LLRIIFVMLPKKRSQPPRLPMTDQDKDQYQNLLNEFREVMYQNTWKLGWNFFFLFVGLLPLMYFFVWIIGAENWELTLFRTPSLMLVGSLVSLLIVVTLLVKIYRDNLKLDALKNDYLTRLNAMRPEIHQDQPQL